MSRDNDRDVREAHALDHFWDRLITGDSGGNAEIDSADITAIHAFHARVPDAEPDPQFVARLETHLMNGIREGFGTAPPYPMFGPNGHGPQTMQATRSGGPTTPALRDCLCLPTGMAARLAAAVVLLVLVVGAVVTVLYPYRERHADGLPLLAPSGTPVVPQLAEQATLFDLTIANTAPFHLERIGYDFLLPPGTSVELSSGNGPSMFYVSQGPVTVRVSAASQPMRVLPARATGAVEAGTAIAAGQQGTLESSMTLVAAAGSRLQLFTTGVGTAEVLWVLSAKGSRVLNRDGVTSKWSSNGGAMVDVTGPFSVVLRQVTLLPDESLPGPGSGQGRQTAATVDPRRVSDMRTMSDGSVRNGGDQPLALYVLTVSPLAEGTPPTGPPVG